MRASTTIKQGTHGSGSEGPGKKIESMGYLNLPCFATSQ